jgi:spermidine/putrescine transport system substrate-binding protein
MEPCAESALALPRADNSADTPARSAGRRAVLQGLGAAAIGISFSNLAGCNSRTSSGAKIAGTGEEPNLNFYNWDTYVGENTLSDFQAASNIDVSMSFFANNDELFAKLRGGNPGFDVIVPSDDAVSRLSQAGLLQPLDHDQLPNYKNVSPDFRDVPFDPKRKFSMPYTWLVMGIGYRKSKVNGVPDSWKWLYDSDAYKGRIALVSEAGDVIRIGARYLGYDINEITPEIIAKVEAMLIKQKPNIKKFHDDDGQELLLNGDVDLVLEFNGDMAQVMKDDPDIGFVIPKEGSQLNADNLAIPVGAPHPKNAHAFINFLLDAQAGKHITETILFPTPNTAAKALMPPEYRRNEVIFPSADIMNRCSYPKFDEKLQPLYEAAFARIRAA